MNNLNISIKRQRLNQGSENLFTKDDKTFPNKIEEDINQWKDILCSWVRRLNTAKMSLLPNVI